MSFDATLVTLFPLPTWTQAARHSPHRRAEALTPPDRQRFTPAVLRLASALVVPVFSPTVQKEESP